MISFIKSDWKFIEARRMERAGKLQEALQLYDSFLAIPLPPEDPFRISAEKSRRILRGEGNFGDRFEQHFKNFFHQVTDPYTLVPMLAGGGAFQIGRLACLGYLGRMPASLLSRGIGASSLAFGLPFLGEVSAFAGTSHGMRALFDAKAPTSPFPQEWAAAALSLGVLKFSGALSHGLAPTLREIPSRLPQQALGASTLVGGLFLCGRLEERLGWREKSKAGDALFDSIVSAASLSLGARLSQRLLGRRYAAALGEMELRMRFSGPPPAGTAGLSRPRLALAGVDAGAEGRPSPLWMASGDQSGSRSGASSKSDLLQAVRKMTKSPQGMNEYLLLYLNEGLQRLASPELLAFMTELDLMMGVASAKERKAMLPGWWETFKACGPGRAADRLKQYGFWLKNLPPSELPALASALIGEESHVEPALFQKLANSSLKRILAEPILVLEEADWIPGLFQRLPKAQQDSFLKSLKRQVLSGEVRESRRALELLSLVQGQFDSGRLLAWTRECLRQVNQADPLVQGAMWRNIQSLMEKLPDTERKRLLPDLRRAMAADQNPQPAYFFFYTLGKALDYLDLAGANLLARDLLVKMTAGRPEMVKGLLICFYERMDRLSRQNRELLLSQLEILFDKADPALRSALLVETSHFRDLWKKLDPIEQATLLRRWERGLASGDPEEVLRQAENLIFTSPAADIDRKIELFLKLESKAASGDLPAGLRRRLAQKLQKMGQELPSDQKGRLVTSTRERRQSQSPFPMAGYLLRDLSHPESTDLAEALGLSKSQWPGNLPPAIYPKKFTEWQHQILEVTKRPVPAPVFEPVTIGLSEVQPYHYVIREDDPGSYLRTMEEIREKIFRSLILDGWRPGEVPKADLLREVMTSTELGLDNYPPIVAAAGPSGASLLMNGHHRTSALISLVADGFLPPITLKALPFVRIHSLSSAGILQEASGLEHLPTFGWKDVLAFHPPSLKLLERLGYQASLDSAFNLREVK